MKMSKLFLVLITGLGIFLTACEKEAPPSDNILSKELTSRTADNLNLELTSALGATSTYQATRVEVTYQSSTAIAITLDFADSSSYSTEAVLISILPDSGFELELESDQGILSNLDDLQFSVCSPAVCYTSTSTSSGVGSYFIIEDMVEGI